MLFLSIEAQNIFIIGLLLFVSILLSIHVWEMHKRGSEPGIHEGKVGVKNRERTTVEKVIADLVLSGAWVRFGDHNLSWPASLENPRYAVKYHHENGYCLWDRKHDLPVGYWVESLSDEQNFAYLLRDLEIMNATDKIWKPSPLQIEMDRKLNEVWAKTCQGLRSITGPIERDPVSTAHWDAPDTAPLFVDRLRESFANKIVSAFEFIADDTGNYMPPGQSDTIRQSAMSSMWEGGALESMQPGQTLEHWVDVKLATYFPAVYTWPGSVGAICKLIRK